MVINTCSVRERAEEKLYTRLGELRQLAAEHGHNPIVAVAGCVAQQEGTAILKRAPGVTDVIVGTQAIRQLPMMIEQASLLRRPVINLDPMDDVTFPVWRDAACRSGQGVCDDHRRVQRVLQLLRRPVHAGKRAHAAEGGYRGGGP